MSWHKVTLPLLAEIDPKVVELGKLGWDIYEKENKPAGFAMFHATRGSNRGLNDKMLVYFSPVAAELCNRVIAEKYVVERCDVPARDEPDMAYVFGDPLVMGHLKERFVPEVGTVEWEREQAALVAILAHEEAAQAELEAAQAQEATEESAKADSAQAQKR